MNLHCCNQNVGVGKLSEVTIKEFETKAFMRNPRTNQSTVQHCCCATLCECLDSNVLSMESASHDVLFLQSTKAISGRYIADIVWSAERVSLAQYEMKVHEPTTS